MDLNCFPISLILVALQVQFVSRSKIEFINNIIQDRGEHIYQAFLRSSRLLIIPKILKGNLWFFKFISDIGLYWSSIIFLVRWATSSLTGIWQWKICGKHNMNYNMRITTYVEHLSSFKLEYLLHLKIPRCYQSINFPANSRTYQRTKNQSIKEIWWDKI